MKRVTFYVDGFNFYYGLKTEKKINSKWKKAYWINIVKLFEQFLGKGQVLEKVVYFTASPLNKDKSSRQSAFLNVNKLINGDKFEIVRGKYLNKIIECPKCHYSISRPEEKKTDVSLSIRMIGDCIQDKTDILVLVSGDSDFIPPIEFLQKNYQGKNIKVYFPPAIFSSDLSANMKKHRSKPVFLKNNLPKFLISSMTDVVTKDGKSYSIPDKWK
ncbi:MAG TPA: NYN domain-containing protein [Porphyromonadaceae bacterium]|nr:NYN domain-containing protein [Porphyromonadaceae bacterium]